MISNFDLPLVQRKLHRRLGPSFIRPCEVTFLAEACLYIKELYHGLYVNFVIDVLVSMS